MRLRYEMKSYQFVVNEDVYSVNWYDHKNSHAPDMTLFAHADGEAIIVWTRDCPVCPTADEAAAIVTQHLADTEGQEEE